MPLSRLSLALPVEHGEKFAVTMNACRDCIPADTVSLHNLSCQICLLIYNCFFFSSVDDGDRSGSCRMQFCSQLPWTIQFRTPHCFPEWFVVWLFFFFRYLSGYWTLATKLPKFSRSSATWINSATPLMFLYLLMLHNHGNCFPNSFLDSHLILNYQR